MRKAGYAYKETCEGLRAAQGGDLHALSDDDRSGGDLGGHILPPHGGGPRVRLMFSIDNEIAGIVPTAKHGIYNPSGIQGVRLG